MRVPCANAFQSFEEESRENEEGESSSEFPSLDEAKEVIQKRPGFGKCTGEGWMKKVCRNRWKRVDLCAVETEADEWGTVEVSVDSGAVVTVGPKEKCTGYPLEETEASRKGQPFYGANGSKIKNYGMRRVKGVTEEGHGATLPMQAADVLRILASVRQMIHAGNRVVFDKDGSYIQHKESGKSNEDS